jgi:hypothetical protein
MSFLLLGRERIINNSDVLRHLPMIPLLFPLGGVRSRLLVTDLELNQEGILRELILTIAVGARTRAAPRMVAKLVIDFDLSLDLGWKILEVVVQSDDRARVQIIAYLGVRIELFIPHNRLKVFERPIGNIIFPVDIPCPPLNTKGSVSAANGLGETGSLSRGTDSGLIGCVMPLPVLTLQHQAGKVARIIAEINTVPVHRSFPTSVDVGIVIIARSRNHRKTNERNVRRHHTDPSVAGFGAIGSGGVGLVTIVVHDPAHILHPIAQSASDIGKIVALLDEVDRADRAISRPINGPSANHAAAANRVEIGCADDIAETAGGFRENAEGHTENAHPNDVEIGRDAGDRSEIDIGFTKDGGRVRSPQGLAATGRSGGAARCVDVQILTLHLYQGVPFRDEFVDFSVHEYLGPPDREVILAFALGGLGVQVRVLDLQGVQSDVELVAQRREPFDLGFPFFKNAYACIQIRSRSFDWCRWQRWLRALCPLCWGRTLCWGLTLLSRLRPGGMSTNEECTHKNRDAQCKDDSTTCHEYLPILCLI